MAGLASAAAPENDEAMGDEPQPNVTPEEQAQYEMIVKNALEIIYPKGEEALSPEVSKSLTGSDKPVLNLALTAVTVIQGLVASAKQAGKPLDQEVLFHAGTQILEELAEAAEAFKIHDYSEEDVEHALYLAVDMYREQATQAGDINPDEMKGLFAELQQADQEGRFDELAPGAAEHAKKIMPKEAEEAAEQAPAEDEDED